MDTSQLEKTNPVTPDKTREDWILCALAALAEGGVDAIKIERLARKLKVSKGSFYWHFKDRAALLSAVLDLWDGDFTQQLIDNAAHLPSPAERLRFLMVEALVATVSGVDSARAEAAVQAWASRDEMAARRLRAVEAQRVKYLVSELTALGLAPAEADSMAKVLYLALLGLYATRSYNPAIADNSAYLALVELVLDMAPR
ncbi:TetR family transcriptional regulator [Mesorhizobium sp. NBSH29]|uniref:TetR/AcrR family transcriptional regulator n=1 Tax=Mesorhizobium sp. NBSH29 TaxID=2654249 RepID=UPI001896916E|nr:TetR/AcrR family transcriptional regulator [Mesorhizobium sp. NBSH29]QPC85296.1 TetR family transcriptional regulator [Mesorhizobium sp. NBSH29]